MVVEASHAILWLRIFVLLLLLHKLLLTDNTGLECPLFSFFLLSACLFFFVPLVLFLFFLGSSPPFFLFLLLLLEEHLIPVAHSHDRQLHIFGHILDRGTRTQLLYLRRTRRFLTNWLHKTILVLYEGFLHGLSLNRGLWQLHRRRW